MTIDFIYRYDNNIYAFLLLTILLFVVIVKKDIFDFSRKMFFRMILFNMAILLIEILAWVFDGVDTNAGFFANYLFNCMLILMEPMMAALWLSYVDYKIYNSKERLKKRLYYMHASIFAGILLIINVFTPIAFTLDDNNIYHRGDWLWLSLVFVFGLVIYTIVLAVKNRKEITGKMIRFIALFALLPVLVSFIQLFVYGLILTWAVVALGIVFAYYLLEITGNTEDHLTGLYSRKKIEEILTGKLEQQNGFSVIMLDLEFFKKINDRYGHKVGDETLVQLSKVLLRVFKEDFYVSRIGGDEFLIVSKNHLDGDVNSYKSTLTNEVMKSNYPYLKEIGVSFGAKTYEVNEVDSVDKILDEVDLLMYEDKSRNKNYKRRKTDR